MNLRNNRAEVESMCFGVNLSIPVLHSGLYHSLYYLRQFNHKMVKKLISTLDDFRHYMK